MKEIEKCCKCKNMEKEITRQWYFKNAVIPEVVRVRGTTKKDIVASSKKIQGTLYLSVIQTIL